MLRTTVDALAEGYADRLALARSPHQRATGVVGRIGNTVPAELILACGWLPVLVAAEMGAPTPSADVYMEPIIAPETRSLFEFALNGAYADFELLVLSRPYAQLYYYMKEVFRQGKARQLPPLHMYDLMQSQREAVRAYNWERTRALAQRLETVSGVELTETRLRKAILLTDGVRALQRDLLERRWQARLSGLDALRAIGAGYFMAPDAYAAALRAYLRELDAPRPDLQKRKRLLVLPCEPLSHTYLHAALEDAAALVVAEDDWWGSRAPGSDVPPTGSALEGIFLKYWTDTATQNVYPAEARETWLATYALRPDVDGIVFYLPPSDHQLGWDYPRLQAWLEDRAKPTLLVREDAATAEGRAAVTARAAKWLETLA